MTEIQLQLRKVSGPDTELAKRQIWFGRCFLLHCLWLILLYSHFSPYEQLGKH